MAEREDYLYTATSHIRDKKKRQEVKEELSAHLDDMAACYMRCGTPEEEAYKLAVSEMGDAGELSYKLGELHSFFPAKDMKNALTLFITGFVLVSFYIDVWYLKPITNGIGSVLLFLALYKLKDSGKLFKLSFLVYTAAMIAGAAVEAITALPCNLSVGTWPDVVTHILALVSTASYILAASGTARLLPEEKSTNLRMAEGAYGIMTLIVVLANAGGILFLISMIYLAVRLGDAKRYLWANEWEGGAKALPKKKAAILVLAAVIVCAAPYLTAITVTLCPPSTELYKLGEETEQLRKIKQELISSGAEEALFDDMLCDDVMLLEGARPGKKQSLYFSAAEGEDMVCELYPFTNEDRCLFVIKYKYSEAPKKTRACQIYFRTIDQKNGSVPLEIDARLTPDHAVSLFDKDGTTVRAKSYVRMNFSDGSMEYKAKRGADAQRGYFMFAVKGLPEYATGYYIGFYEQDNPLRIPFLNENLDQWQNSRQGTETPDMIIWENITVWAPELNEVLG